MSSIVTSQGIVHYETYGRGRPVILLHGWINSWGVWQDSMIDLAENGRHRVYALDFWGFGDSGKTNTPPFRVDSYSEMVNQFIEKNKVQTVISVSDSCTADESGTMGLLRVIAYE